jgi:virginiamycin B lyase
MRRFVLTAPILACMLATSPAWAVEELSAEKLAVQARVHRLVHAMEFGFDSLWGWITKGNLVRVDPTNNEITEISIYGTHAPSAIAIGEGAVWVSDSKGKTIFKIDPNDYSVMKEIRVPTLATRGSISVGEGAVWVVTSEGLDRTLTRFNAGSGLMEAKISLPSGGFDLVVGYGSVWVTGYATNELYQIDPSSNTITSIVKLHEIPHSLAAGEGSVWVFSQGASSVQRIDAHTGAPVATIQTGLPPGSGSIATGGGYVWVSIQGVPVAQIDPKTNTLIRRFIGGHGIGGYIRYGAGSLWIAGGRISRFRAPE